MSTSRKSSKGMIYVKAGVIGFAVFAGFQIGLIQLVLAFLLPVLLLSLPLIILGGIACTVAGLNPFQWFRDKISGKASGRATKTTRAGTELSVGYNPTKGGPVPYVGYGYDDHQGHSMHGHQGYVDPLSPYQNPNATSWHGDDALAHEFGFTEADIPMAEALDMDGEGYY